MGGNCTNGNVLTEELLHPEPITPKSSNNSSFSSCTFSTIEQNNGVIYTLQSQQDQTEKRPIKSKFYVPKSNSTKDMTTASRPKRLEFTVMDSQIMNVGTTIQIKPDEINEESHDLDKSFNFGKDETNDYCFPDGERMGSKQFTVKYKPIKNEYFIKDSYIGTGLFMHITERQAITKNVICFGNTQFLASCNNQILKIQCLRGEYEGKCIEISPTEKTYVKLGRSKNCDVIFNEPNASRCQCTFIYENGDWFVYDGKPGVPSTNGVWLLANKYVCIKNGLIFKSGLTTFVARVY